MRIDSYICAIGSHSFRRVTGWWLSRVSTKRPGVTADPSVLLEGLDNMWAQGNEVEEMCGAGDCTVGALA